ncbi:hypothetical protein VOLCADRAFT_96890 [Volvox carteri f. nagariensis]|uniref:Cilia- and flagella-associated protein 69 ARM repeats domain-containing protein n=1 Tax=Volvox carteri f. nagariensis TaxID=3068 RepID=D8UBK7_VOLCA|nr:uncharacterized protein VOLCADRAFT_96890 [Volvox carteri f. nagariensis]EFJ42961.1 hypothetical protein VOLCADRAFT_96890 [Volvox carteri f. nagariensis]|eukprot:XP_002956001.1 hypothetical protein VOLCADRAFT_96890 [Volvox carteri f. nagariensis]
MDASTASLTASNGPAVDLDKVIALFTGPNSADLHERHVAAINRLCRSNQNGFTIRDLPKVQQVLELSVALLKRGIGLFLEPVCELVSLLGKPFIRRTATDEFKMLNHITNVLAAVGNIVCTVGLPSQLQIVAAQTITTFANAYGNRPNVLELSQQQAEPAEGAQRQYHTNQSLLNKSGVITNLIIALARALLANADAADAALVAPITGTLLAMSYNADNCTSMVDAGVLQCLAALLARGARSETACMATEITWNVVENAPLARSMLGQPLTSLQRLARGGDGGGDGGSGGGAAEATATAGPGPGSNSLRGPAGGGSTLGTYRSTSGRPNGAAPGGFDGSVNGGGGGRDAVVSRGNMGAALGFSPPPDGGGGGDGHDEDDEWAATLDDSLGGADANGNGRLSYNGFGEPPDIRGGGAGGGAESSSRGDAGGVTAIVGAGDSGVFGVATAVAEAAASADEPVMQSLANALAGLLRWLLLNGFSKADKELRNDVLVVINLLLEAPDFRAAAAHVHVFEPLLAAATCPELATRPELVANYALTTDALDHELRLLVWTALMHGCLLPEVLAAAAGGFMRVLLLYVNIGEGHPAVRRWNPDQLAALRAAALSKLHTLSPLCPDEYERAGGTATLLSFVGAAPLAAHLEAALRHVHHLFTLVPESRDSFGAAGLIPNQRRLRKADGVRALLTALARLRALDPLLPAPYAVAVLDCVWASIVPDRKSTAKFLVEQGLDHVLKHLEAGNKGHRPVALRLLSDLLENPRSHTFFHEWMSDVDKKSAAHLLLSIWMEEDTLRGMSGGDGLLANPANPLAGLERRTRWLPPENVAYGNMSSAKKEVVEMVMDHLNGEVVLAKIYGIFKLIGFDSCSYLDQRDHAVLAAVEKYAKFRQGGVWRSIQADFEAEGIQPTAPDRLRLESGIELSASLAMAVREAQARLLGGAQATLKTAETRLYDGMRAQAKLEAEYRFIQLQERTPLTLAEMRRAKEQKATMLANSLQSFQIQDVGEHDG